MKCVQCFDFQAPGLAKQTEMFLPGLLFSFPVLSIELNHAPHATREEGLVTRHTATSLTAQITERAQQRSVFPGSNTFSSYGTQSMVGHLPRFPHTAQLQHFQASITKLVMATGLQLEGGKTEILLLSRPTYER